MNLVHRSVLGTFLRYLLLTMVGALILFTLVDVFEHIGSFLDNDATASMVGRYYLYRAVWIIDTVLPVAMLMATLFTVGSMARYNELTALFASGRSLLQVTRPILILGLLVSLFSLSWREYVLPKANIACTRVWETEIHKRPEKIRPTQNIAATGEDGRIYYARSFNPNTQVVSGLRVVRTHEAQVVERIDAVKAEWTGQFWILFNGTRREFTAEQEIVTSFTQEAFPDLTLTPQTLYKDRVKREDMTIRQLRQHVELIGKSGGDTAAGEVDIQFQLAFPAVNIIVVFMGILLASGPRKTTVASGFGLTVLISFGYYFLMNFGRALGHNGALPPVLAGWSGNFVYGLVCWGLYMFARR